MIRLLSVASPQYFSACERVYTRVVHVLLTLHPTHVKFVPSTYRKCTCKMSRKHARACRYLYNLIIYIVLVSLRRILVAARVHACVHVTFTWPYTYMPQSRLIETTKTYALLLLSFILLILHTIVKQNVSNVRSRKLYYSNIVS